MKKLYSYQTQIFLRDTDATGVLFAAEQVRMGTETLEMFLHSRGKSLQDIVNSSYLIPIVHVESDYLEPLFLSDPITITMYLEKIGTKSLTFFYEITRGEIGQKVGSVRVVHVCVHKDTRTSVELPSEILDFFVF